MSKVHLADKDTLDSVNDKVGTGSDAASSAPTTLFAGIKHLISTLTNHVANWTAARAAKIDSIDTNAARITATRAGYIDLLGNATNGLAAIKTAALSAKSWYAGYGNTITAASKTTETKVISDGKNCSGNSKTITILTFEIPENGVYRIDATFKTGLSSQAGAYNHDATDYTEGNLKIGVRRATLRIGETSSDSAIFDGRATANVATTKTGYAYFFKGERISITALVGNWCVGYYQWAIISSVTVKYVKKEI